MGGGTKASLHAGSRDGTGSELIAHCQSRLAKYKTPKRVEFLESMPKTNIGKIQKKELRKLAQARTAGA